MCGIAGIYATKNLQHRLQLSTASLQHRGPEHRAFYKDEELPFALGHQRLCIIDGSAAAMQPLRYQNRYVIVHNGELYNYIEIKKELSQKGFVFHTRSDTEVIAAAYACWGEQCLPYFDGAFAFGIWDELEKTLFAARDPVGEKPLFFYQHNGEFLFASEIKALWAAGVPRQVNESMLYNYLTLGYTVNPFNAQETFYQNIHKLPAGALLHFDAASEALTIGQYYTVAIEEKSIPDEAAIATFGSLLQTSVQRRLRSDVPAGISLSGGLDSSAIAAICAQQNKKLHCFTASFSGYEKDETAIAAKVAAQLGLPHHVVPVAAADLLESMHAVMHHQEEPVQSASVVAQYKVYEAAKKAGVAVMLDGQGADETLAGYHKYYHWWWQELYAKKALAKSGELQAARALGIGDSFGYKNKMAAVAPHFTAALWQRIQAQKAAGQRGLDKAFAHRNRDAFAYALPAQLTLNGALHYNTFTNGLEELLRYADRNSMAHAVEVRLPFISADILNFLFTLPPHFKMRNGWTKWLLRQTVKDLLPQDVVWRKDKIGFEPPQKTWMQNAGVEAQMKAAKKLLVDAGVLSKTVLQQNIKAAAAHAPSLDWRWWSASHLFR